MLNPTLISLIPHIGQLQGRFVAGILYQDTSTGDTCTLCPFYICDLLEWMSVISGVNFSSDMAYYSDNQSSEEYKQQ